MNKNGNWVESQNSRPRIDYVIHVVIQFNSNLKFQHKKRM